MPILQLGDLSTPDGLLLAKIEVDTVMAWPGEDQERDRENFRTKILAYELSRCRAYEEKMASALADQEPAVQEMLAKHREHNRRLTDALACKLNVDGADAVARLALGEGLDSLSEYRDRCTEDCVAAGRVLSLMASMDQHHRAELSTHGKGGASVKRAIHVLAQTPGPKSMRYNRTSLKSAWSRFKPVAHIGAAMHGVLVVAASTPTAPKPGQETARASYHAMMSGKTFIPFLGLAAAFQRFGLRYVPHGRKKPILDREKIWLLPDDGPWPQRDFKPDPLPPKLLEWAKAYKAPRSDY